MKKQFFNSKIFLLIGAVFLIATALFYNRFKIVVGGDASVYINQGLAIANGTTQNLYEYNKLIHSLSLDHAGPILYPPGFPLILAFVFKLIGEHLWIISLLNLIFIFFGVYFAAKSFRLNGYLLIVFSSLFIFNSSFFYYSTNVLSDLPFFLFSVISIFLFLKYNRKSFFILFIVGALSGFAFLIRTNGLLLPFTFILYYFTIYKTLGFRNVFLNCFPIILGFSTIALLVVFYPDGGMSHTSRLQFDIPIFLDQLWFNIQLLGRSFHYRPLFWILLPIIILGLWDLRKKSYLQLYLIYFALTILIYTIWPYRQGLRFFFPIIPLIYLGFIHGTYILSLRYRMLNFLFLIVPLFLLIILVRSKDIHGYRSYEEQIFEYKELVRFLSETYDTDSYFISMNNRRDHFFTGLNFVRGFGGSFEYDINKIRSLPSQILVVPLHAVQNNKFVIHESFLKLYQDNFYVVYKVANENEFEY
jgi:hypothetical protein